jgi:hypothetical protein
MARRHAFHLTDDTFHLRRQCAFRLLCRS